MSYCLVCGVNRFGKERRILRAIPIINKARTDDKGGREGGREGEGNCLQGTATVWCLVMKAESAINSSLLLRHSTTR